MRHETRRNKATRSGRLVMALTAGSTVLAPSIAFADAGASYGSYGWVWATLVSVLIVAAVWLASGTAMRAFIRLRWLPRERKVGLNRAINVFFGALLLMALVLPYLAVTSPMFAFLGIGAFVVASMSALMFRRPATDRDDIQLQE